MPEYRTPGEIEAAAKAAGISIEKLCETAGVAPSTFRRWKGGKNSPSLDVVLRLRDALPKPPSPTP